MPPCSTGWPLKLNKLEMEFSLQDRLECVMVWGELLLSSFFLFFSFENFEGAVVIYGNVDPFASVPFA